MFLRKAALRPIPDYAVVPPHTVDALERSLDDDDAKLQERLDEGYRDLDRRQPIVGRFLAEELGGVANELVQSLGYFLTVTVFLMFREAFPMRLREVDSGGLAMALATLEADEEIRANDPHEILESDDVVAMGQPSVVAFVQHHVDEALEQSEGDVDLDELDSVYRAVLVEVIALSHAVASRSGQVGPSPENLA